MLFWNKKKRKKKVQSTFNEFKSKDEIETEWFNNILKIEEFNELNFSENRRLSLRQKIVSRYEEELKKIEFESNSYAYFLGIFKTKNLKKEIFKKHSQIKNQLIESLKTFDLINPPNKYNRVEHISLLHRIQILEKNYLEITSREEREIKKLNQENKKTERLVQQSLERQRILNLAYQNKKEKRVFAEKIKKQLSKSENCPYCEKSLGDKPHADHIYPIANGGQSVTQNMIYVCYSCNQKKRDMTLYAFAEKYQLDFEQITLRLRSQNKWV